MGLFGGSWSNENPDSHGNHLNSQVGWCTVPHKGNAPDQGAEVYLFFEHGDINHPVYFAAVQAGQGWFSEHDNQHVFKSDNVTIRIDENTADPKSTTKFSPYVTNNSELSKTDLVIHKKQQDMQAQNIQTRLDIQIQASKMIAVNLQISGDVNIKQIGDMYIEQQGDRHQTLIGDRYVKHVGHTYIEHEGNYISTQTGKKQEAVSGNCIQTIFGDNRTKTTGLEHNEVLGSCDFIIGNSFNLNFEHDFNLTVAENMTATILRNFKLKVGKSIQTIAAKNYSIEVGTFGENNTGFLDITTVNNTNITSRQGNILITTLGQFELLNSQDVITAEGYKNIGTKGNIKLISNMGNIGIETIGNKAFEKSDVVIPWNPSFLENLQIISQMIKGFDVNNVLFTRKDFNFQNVYEVLNFIINLPLTIIYDGLPTILPCKMITQNPNIQPVKTMDWKDNLATLTPGEYRNFSTVDDDWHNVTNEAYWKVIGRLVGNIDIKSWSGDINIATQGRLGNAGNINISAKDSVGTLPDYKAGNLNISNKAKSKIHNDPRHYFLDSQNIFYRTRILTNGNSAVPGKLFKYFDVVNKKGTAGGCASCISEYLFYLMGTVAPLQKTFVQLMSFNVPFHMHNPLTKIPDEDWKTSLIQTGYDHAYDNGMIDDFNTINHGVMTISSDGPLHISAEKDYKLDTNKAYGSDGYSLSIKTTPNWQYGELSYLTKIYYPLKRHGINMGNTLTINQSYGNKYQYTFLHQQTKQLMYGPELYTNLPNMSTDKDIISCALTIGKYSNVVNENYNLQWVYVPPMITYFDPTFVLADPNGIPIPDIDVAIPNLLDIIDTNLKGLKKLLKSSGAKNETITTIIDAAKGAITKSVDQLKKQITSLGQDAINGIINGSITDILANAQGAISQIGSLVDGFADKVVSEVTTGVTKAIQSVVSLLLGAPIVIPMPAYMETYNNNNSYIVNESINSKNFTQYLTKTAIIPITIVNDFHQIKNTWNIHAEQEINLNGVPVTHFVEENEGLYAISNFWSWKNANSITQNFNAATTIAEIHDATIMNSQTYNSLTYNKNVNAAAEAETYIGTRVITDNLVTWAVSQLNFVQK